MATIREIAAKSGYSPAAVSRLLNNDPSFSISPAARNKILKTAESLNYQQSIGRKNPHYQVAVLFAVLPQKELEDTYFSQLRTSIVDYAAKSDLNLTFYHHIYDIPTNIDGFLAIGQFKSSELDQLAILSKHGVFVDSNPDASRFNAVQPNLQSITERAIDLFIAAGKKQIGFIGGQFWQMDPATILKNDARQKYFESHMHELGLYQADNIFIGNNFSVTSGYQLGKKICQNHTVETLPDAFLVASDPLAIGILQAFNEYQITVPNDTAIISVNNIDIAKYVAPPLTTFEIDTNELGRIAINRLKESIIFQHDYKQTILLDAPLIYRKSFPVEQTKIPK